MLDVLWVVLSSYHAWLNLENDWVFLLSKISNKEFLLILQSFFHENEVYKMGPTFLWFLLLCVTINVLSKMFGWVSGFCDELMQNKILRSHAKGSGVPQSSVLHWDHFNMKSYTSHQSMHGSCTDHKIKHPLNELLMQYTYTHDSVIPTVTTHHGIRYDILIEYLYMRCGSVEDS